MDAGFVSNIQSDDILRDNAKYFDEIMLLYILFGSRKFTSITLVNDRKDATFHIKFNDPVECKRVYESLNDRRYAVYGKQFIVTIFTIDEFTIELVVVGA